MTPGLYLDKSGYGSGTNFSTTGVMSLMKGYAELVAREYQRWLNGQVLAGRTDSQLWKDFSAEYFAIK